MYKNQLINMILADSLQLDSRRSLEDYTVSLLINGVKSLTDMAVEDLEQEVFDRYSYKFDAKEADLLADDNNEFKKWVLKQRVMEYV